MIQKQMIEKKYVATCGIIGDKGVTTPLYVISFGVIDGQISYVLI